MKFKTKHFGSCREANKFAQKTLGVIEGPFVDFDGNVEYIVFYRPEREPKQEEA